MTEDLKKAFWSKLNFKTKLLLSKIRDYDAEKDTNDALDNFEKAAWNKAIDAVLKLKVIDGTTRDEVIFPTDVQVLEKRID